MNTYRHESSLYIDGDIIPSQEGTTQGDPLAMALFALTTLPLIHKLSREVKQCSYADEASAGGELQHIKVWWDDLTQLGPQYGYFPNPEKTWLIVKDEHFEAASATFAASGIQLTKFGREYLGTAIGSADFFVKMKIEGWTYEIEQLSVIARTHPHVAYAAYTHGLSHKWKFLLRTIPNIGNLLTPLETAVCHSLIPFITGKNDLNNHMRSIMSLSTRLGGLGLDHPQSESDFEYSASCKVCNLISELILQQSGQLNFEIFKKHRKARLAVWQERR